MSSTLERGRAACEMALQGELAPCIAWLQETEHVAFASEPEAMRNVAALVLAARARDAVLQLDVARLASLDARARSLHPTASPGAPDVATALLGAWQCLFAGDAASALESASRCAGNAAERREAHVLVDANALVALAHLALGNVNEGLRIARRASRMARTEAIPSVEALAHLVLARARRESGHPHLALRITRSLARSPVASHRAWLALERALAGGIDHEADDHEADGSLWPNALHAWVRAAESGDATRFEAETAALRLWSARLPGFLRGDLEALVMASDVRLAVSANTPVAAFLRGESAEVPACLRGLATLRGTVPEGENNIVYVAAPTHEGARRVVRLGRALASHGLHALKPTRMKQGRSETVVAALLLAGPAGLSEEACFRAVYGFAFVPDIHRGAFDVTLHRTREWLGELASIERRAGTVSIAMKAPLLCPDPRCSRSVSDNILVALADQGARSAKDISDATGVPLRTVQAALAELVEEGACDARQGSGRAVEYLVEDTTFSDPTQAR